MSWGPFDVTGKNTIVTGGAMGIGWGIVVRFIEGGANVVVVDLDGDLAAEKLSGLSGPGEAIPLSADVTEEHAGDRMVEACVDRFGSVDVLINNAGIYPMSPLLEMTREVWQRVLDVNLTGLAFVSRAVGSRMAEQGTGGKIINIASIDALHPSMVGLAAYDSSKGGVLMLTKALALEMGAYEVNVNAIAPGGINTEGAAAPLQESQMTAEEMQAMVEQFKAQIPLGRMGEPDDIATVAAFLASPAADYITGEMIVVDGGRLLK